MVEWNGMKNEGIRQSIYSQNQRNKPLKHEGIE